MTAHEAEAILPPLMVKHIGMFTCPACKGPLRIVPGDGISCPQCNRLFSCEQGIPLLFWPNEWEGSNADVTDTIRSFYEENPFPNYEDADSVFALVKKAEQGIFAKMLSGQVSPAARVLEVGCGTGQLSNYLGAMESRVVFGTDLCLNSLKLGEAFRKRNRIDNVAFLQTNLFRPCFQPESFDVVLCNGVLHHTSNPLLGFRSISKLVKKGGFIVVGLYNLYGRIPTDVRRLIFKFSGKHLSFLDPKLRDKNLGDAKRRAWFMDQYRNPHESKHTFDEVLRWFDQAGFEFINSIPKFVLFEPFSIEEEFFEPTLRGTAMEHLLIQLRMLLSGGREGGFFIAIGRRTNGCSRMTHGLQGP